MKKILLVSGCSFTDKNFYSGVHPEMDTSYPKWPELLAKKLDMDCINLGQSGAGNEYIYSSLLETILETKDKSQIGLVMPAWSQCQRKDYQEGYSYILNNQYGLIAGWRYGHRKQERVDPNGDVFSWIRKSLRYYISLQTLCERYNIPYKQFQMISLYDGWINGLAKPDFEIKANLDNPDFVKKYTYPGNVKKDRPKCQKIMMDYEPYIDVKNFIGWPTADSIVGFHIEQKTLRMTGQDRKSDYDIDCLLSEEDVHPNEKGHQKIAEFLYDRLG